MRLFRHLLLAVFALLPLLNGCTVYIPSGNLLPAPTLQPPRGALPPGQAPARPVAPPAVSLLGVGAWAESGQGRPDQLQRPASNP
jgi:hypothetical protein